MAFDGLLRARFHEGADVTLDDAKENIALAVRLVGNQRVLVLVDLRPIRSQSAGARAYFAGPEAQKVCGAVALIIGSPLSRMVGNFYLGFNRPKMPTRLFTSIEEGERWLRNLEGVDHVDPR